MVEANIMSASFALSHLSDNPLLPTTRSLWIGPCSTIEGIRILHDVPVWYDKTKIGLDFHIFKVQDFDVLIGHLVEKLFQNISSLETLDITLGGKDFSSLILRSKDSLAESMPQEEQVDEVRAIFPAKTPESSLDKDAELFIQEEDDQEETFESAALLQKSSQGSLKFRESGFAVPCLETPIAEHSVDHVLLEEVKLVSAFVSPKPISHLYETERPPSPSSEFKPCPSGPMFHIESLEEENFCAMDLSQTLQPKIENSTNEQETFEFSQDSWPHKESLESIAPSTTCSHQDHNHLLVLPSKMYRRVVVDAFVYRKHSKFRGSTMTLTLQLERNRRMMVKEGATSLIDSCRKKPPWYSL